MNRKNTPLISVIIPAYNAEKYISEAITSILNQTFRYFELIAIDDCSTDNTFRIIKHFSGQDSRVVAVSNTKNLKLAKTLNLGISMARGKYIARMDADDWSFPDRLEKQFTFLEKHRNVGILGGSMVVCDQSLNPTTQRQYQLTNRSIRKRLFFYSPFSHPTIMIRKSILDKSGNYDPDFNPAEDYELYFRIGQVSKFANLQQVLLKYRVVPHSMTTGGTKKMELMTLNIRKRYFNAYKATISERIFCLIQYFSVYIIPYSIKSKIFYLTRSVYK